MKKNSKHDNLVMIVYKELQDRGFNDIHKEYEYCSRNKKFQGIYGEIDVFCKNYDYRLVFECKSNKTYKSFKKAKEQLSRSNKCFFYKDKRIFNFLIYYDKQNKVVYEWVR